jgi:two-component system sensor histidine kinase UhpB
MNLKLHLLSRIILIGFACLIATTAWVLYQADQEFRHEARSKADSIGRQLELQLLRINAGFDHTARFPDLGLWQQMGAISGACVWFMPADGDRIRSVCSGGNTSAQSGPDWFESIYRWAFKPGFETMRPVAFRDHVYGAVVIAPSAEIEIANAWQQLRGLMGLSATTVLALCLLVYVTVNRALRPAQVIVAGLESMSNGNLSARLPAFELAEWQRTGQAINQLAASQQQLLAERRMLALKLLTVQEEERRYLARELHDEFGQCLAAINAVTASMMQTAEQDCPALVPEGKNIARITGHMMDLLRGMLLRLRPMDIDELGLSAALNSLIAGWNARNGGKIHYQLAIDGDLGQLPEPVPVNIFRIVQECLTNIAKHSSAANAKVMIKLSDGLVELQVEDDGIADKLPFEDSSGIGLLGMRERVTALGGQLTLAPIQTGGLMVRAWLPLQPATGAPA